MLFVDTEEPKDQLYRTQICQGSTVAPGNLTSGGTITLAHVNIKLRSKASKECDLPTKCDQYVNQYLALLLTVESKGPYAIYVCNFTFRPLDGEDCFIL